MQFWIIDKDPTENATSLPVMALKTNIREGWQILSDIGHINGIKWEGQNKPYSLSHVCTRSHCVNCKAFKSFIAHYFACCFRINGFNTYIDKFSNFLHSDEHYKLLASIPEDRTNEQFMAEYLLSKEYNKRGARQMTPYEVEVVENVANGERICQLPTK